MGWIYNVLESYGLFSSMPIAAAAAAVYAVIRAIYDRLSTQVQQISPKFHQELGRS